jgi:hypothetical protein
MYRHTTPPDTCLMTGCLLSGELESPERFIFNEQQYTGRSVNNRLLTSYVFISSVPNLVSRLRDLPVYLFPSGNAEKSCPCTDIRSRINFVIFQVLTAASVKMTAFWDITPCSFVEIDRRLRGVLPPSWGWFIAPMMEAVRASETSVYSETTQRFLMETVLTSETSVCFIETRPCYILESCHVLRKNLVVNFIKFVTVLC